MSAKQSYSLSTAISCDNYASKVTKRWKMEVSLQDLIADYYHCTVTGDRGYSFISVLSSQEAVSFLHALSPEQRAYCYNKRSFPTKEWITVLHQIPLESVYFIFRRSYLGEFEGIEENSLKKTGEFVKIFVTGGEGASQLMSRPWKNVLVHKNHCVQLRNDVHLPSPSLYNKQHDLDDSEVEVF